MISRQDTDAIVEPVYRHLNGIRFINHEEKEECERILNTFVRIYHDNGRDDATQYLRNERQKCPDAYLI